VRLRREKVVQKTEVERLKELSQDYSRENKRNYEEALSEAKKKNWLIESQSEDGSLIRLVGIEDGVPVYEKNDNSASADTISTDEVLLLAHTLLMFVEHLFPLESMPRLKGWLLWLRFNLIPALMIPQK
jgi:hypothetical protein